MALGDRGLEQPSRTSLYTLRAGEHLILPQVNEPLTPTLEFGPDSGDGFYASAAGVLRVAVSGVNHFFWVGTTFNTVTAGGPSLVDEAATSTNPGFVFDGDPDTGVGHTGPDHLALIAGALDCITIREVAGARQVGFYVTAPVSLQTGVAVSAAGVHAALVNLGLITA